MDMCSNISLDFDRIFLKQAKDRIIRREPMIERQQVTPTTVRSPVCFNRNASDVLSESHRVILPSEYYPVTLGARTNN